MIISPLPNGEKPDKKPFRESEHPRDEQGKFKWY